MIEIYKSTNHNYDYNGDAVLHPYSCILDTNGWKLTIDNPADDNAPLFTREAIITVPTWYSDKQLFRIYDYEKSESGITAYARPIFYDSAHDTLLIDTRPTDKTGQGALDIMTAGTRYSAESDITTVNTAYYVRKNLIEAIMSDDENSFLNRWGGQPVFDNYKVIINKRAGGDYGAQARFGYNLNEIEEHVNMDEVATRIVPVGYNGHTLDGAKPWVDSPLIKKYEIVYTKVVKYEDVKLQEDCQDDEPGFGTLKEYQDELVRRAKADFKAGADLPTIEYEVDVVDLAKTSEYESIKDLVKIGYGDTVVCENESLGISTSAKVVNLTWDCILEQNETVNLGDASVTYYDKVSSAVESVNKAINTDGTVKGEQVGGVVDLMKTKMRATALSAKKQADKAILFEDMDPQSPTFGAMAI
ncbi:phage tail spike protein, partial [Muricomes intestini]|uniref:phage tail spike protein n=1 Tax=Muricomes intestini TaxID=1796634 RepID=UPI002FE2C45B